MQRGIHGKGVGTALYEKMEELLKKQNIVNLFACITHPNAESEAFHAARGYEKKAHFEQCGYLSLIHIFRIFIKDKAVL